MATFLYENAELYQAVYVRRTLVSGKDKYERLPFNIVEYDDGSGQFLEPIAALGSGATNPQTFADINPAASQPDLFIVDKPPFNGVTEIR